MENNENKEKEVLSGCYVATWALKRSGVPATEIANRFDIALRTVHHRIKTVQDAIENIITPQEMRTSLAVLFPIAVESLEALLREKDSQTVNNYFNKLAFNDAGDGQKPGLSILFAVLSEKLGAMSLEDLQRLTKSTETTGDVDGVEVKQIEKMEIKETEPHGDVRDTSESEPSVEVKSGGK